MSNAESRQIEDASLEQVYTLIKDELGWERQETMVEFQKSGLTNRNYIVSCNGQKVAVRIGGTQSSELGINRYAESAALQVLDGLAVAPELLYFNPETGHMITHFLSGREFQNQELVEHMEETVALLKKVHQLPPIAYEFSPYQDIEDRIQSARKRQLPLPASLDRLMNKLLKIQHSRAQAVSRFRGLCHNDPFANNFLYDGSVRLLDWEYAGMGDILFDLACMGCSFTPAQKEQLLSHYFGAEEGAGLLSTLDDMIFIVQFWNAMWATLQIGLPHPAYNYSDMANYMFESLEAQL